MKAEFGPGVCFVVCVPDWIIGCFGIAWADKLVLFLKSVCGSLYLDFRLKTLDTNAFVVYC